jgi:tetratricopeptide (TPR) repeat protein
VCKGNLGLALLGQGKYDEANVLFEEVYRLRLQIFGERHTDTQLSQNCIAVLRFAQGQYRESEELARASFRSRQEILTERHPETLESHANIAVALLYQGRALEAEVILQEILQDEPSFWLVPLWKAYLAMALRRQEKNDKARELLGDFLCKTPEGDHEHPHILLCQRELASVLRDLKDYNKSGKLYETVLRSQKRVLGKAHADTLTTQYEIAGSLKAQGRYYEADKMYSKVMEKRTKSLGEKHPDTMLCKGELDSLRVLT